VNATICSLPPVGERGSLLGTGDLAERASVWRARHGRYVPYVETKRAESSYRETPLLVTNTKSALSSGHELLVQFARRHAATTPATAEGFGQWPALVYVPDDKTFAFAQDHARGSALAVVEGQLLPSQRGP